MQRTGTAISALIAVALTLGALWYVQRPVIAREPTREEVQAQAQSGGYRLIDTAELAALRQQDPQTMLLVDTRQPWEYRTGHIPGARQFFHGAHLVVQVAFPRTPGPVPGAGPGPGHRLLLSGPDLSPQRLGGPGGR